MNWKASVFSVGRFSQTLTIMLEDYHNVDGGMIPFKETRTHCVGVSDSEVLRIKEIKFDVSLPDSEFRLAR